MDLWTDEVQSLVLTFVTGLLGIVGAIVLTKLQGYYAELKAEARERVADIAQGRLTGAFDTAVRAAEEWAKAKGDKAGAEKLKLVTTWGTTTFDDLTPADINTQILAAVHRMNYGWQPLKPAVTEQFSAVAAGLPKAGDDQ